MTITTIRTDTHEVIIEEGFGQQLVFLDRSLEYLVSDRRQATMLGLMLVAEATAMGQKS